MITALRAKKDAPARKRENCLRERGEKRVRGSEGSDGAGNGGLLGAIVLAIDCKGSVGRKAMPFRKESIMGELRATALAESTVSTCNYTADAVVKSYIH